MALTGATTIDATGNAAMTLTGARVTDAIVGKFDASDDLTLNATGAQLSALSPATLADADVMAINASDTTLAELATIRGAANPAATVSYSLADTGANLAVALLGNPTVLRDATAIDVTFNNGILDAILMVMPLY